MGFLVLRTAKTNIHHGCYILQDNMLQSSFTIPVAQQHIVGQQHFDSSSVVIEEQRYFRNISLNLHNCAMTLKTLHSMGSLHVSYTVRRRMRGVFIYMCFFLHHK